MCKFKTRFLIALLTFFVGIVLAFIWVTLNNKPVITIEVPPHTDVSDNSISTVKPTVTPITESPVKSIGHFANVKSNGEHQWGFYVELWRQDDKIYGWMSGTDYSRIVGDAPAGILEDVQFDPKTGKISFKAELSDVHEFDGFLTKNKLSGSLLIKNDLCGDPCAKKKKIMLPKSKEESSIMEELYNFGSYQEWKDHMDKIL
jgi:hypothetical protein